MGKSRRLSSPALTQPQTPPTTATTVTAWLTDSDGHVLILRKADEAVFSEPSGNVDGVETLEQALVRGVGLQTGLDLPSISNTDGHTRVQQWEVFQAQLTGERPPVVPQNEYDGGDAAWIQPDDIVTIQPPGGLCACSGCDQLTANAKLFYFQRTNSHAWICAECKSEYEETDGYTLKVRAGYRLTHTLRAVTDTAVRPGAAIRHAGSIISFTTPRRQYVPGGLRR
jgi:ADP-ribose pyrophosphatase YjhB (NUDIX family)